MKDEVISKLDNVVDIIYTPEQIGFDKAILEFIDSLSLYLGSDVETTQKLSPHIVKIQEAYIEKELVVLSDLLYEIKDIIDKEDEF